MPAPSLLESAEQRRLGSLRRRPALGRRWVRSTPPKLPPAPGSAGPLADRASSQSGHHERSCPHRPLEPPAAAVTLRSDGIHCCSPAVRLMPSFRSDSSTRSNGTPACRATARTSSSVPSKKPKAASAAWDEDRPTTCSPRPCRWTQESPRGHAQWPRQASARSRPASTTRRGMGAAGHGS
jgi:hypothetical protein